MDAAGDAEAALPLAGGAEWRSSLYRVATAQFERAADELRLDPALRTRLLEPRRALVVNFPVRMDDGSVRTFTGYRVQHTLTMGPTKGGMRYAAGLSLDECAALAMWMTWKCALLRLPYGGAKGGVRCDPTELSVAELERLTRRFAAELIPIVGPDRDIPAPDMATGEREMAWFMDTYSQQVGFTVPSVVTGKPEVLGGDDFRRTATGLGVVIAIEAVLEHLGRRLAGERFVVQGFGNVGATVAAELHARGAIVAGVADVHAGLLDDDGLDVPALVRWSAEHGGLAQAPARERTSPAAILEHPCDVLVPAALEGQITSANAGRLRCRLVAEAANGPTTPEAEAILAERGIPLLPDIVANGGGVTISYLEWVQGLQHMSWEEDDLHRRLRTHMRDGLRRTLETAERLGVDWRTAALAVSVQHVADAADRRGVYP